MQAISANVSVPAVAAGNVRNGKPAPAQGPVATKVETPQPQQAPGTVTESLSPEQVKQAIAAANEALKAVSSSLEFAQDPSTGKMVARIIDARMKNTLLNPAK